MAKKIVRDYLIFRFISMLPISLMFATYVLFLKENQLALAEIGLINFAYMISIFLFEIPTGVVADIFGRKISILIGIVIVAVSLFVYFFSYSLSGFIIAEVIMALGSSFGSGALDAWVKDTLSQNGFNKSLGGVFSSGEIVTQSAVIIGGTAGALYANISLRNIWLISAVICIVILVPSYFLLKEDYFKKQKLTLSSGWRQMKQIAIDSIEYGYKKKTVWQLIVIYALFVFAVQSLNMQWALVAEQKAGTWVLSIIWPSICVFIMVGLVIAKKVMNKLGKEKIILLSSVLISGLLVIVLSRLSQVYLIFSFFLLHEVSRSMFRPAHKAMLHENIPSEKRATVASFAEMIAHIGAGAGWLLGGFLAESWSIGGCWLISGISLVLIAPLVIGIKSMKKQ